MFFFPIKTKKCFFFLQNYWSSTGGRNDLNRYTIYYIYIHINVYKRIFL